MRLVGRKLRCCLYILCTADVSFVFETRQRVSIICAPAEERVGHPCIHFCFLLRTPEYVGGLFSLHTVELCKEAR